MDGLLILNKEKYISSHDVVNLVRRKLLLKKVGHTGTLDPMASGVLIICLGKATKISDYIMKSKKTYKAKIKLGILTDSYDITGTVLKREKVKKNIEEIELALNSFSGDIYQIPPMYSAIKIRGKKLYEYARKGLEVERKNRLVHIFEIRLVSFNGEDEIEILVTCSSGTYIRTLAYDIGVRLKTYGVLTELTRIRNGNFYIDEALPTDVFKEMEADNIKRYVIPMDEALSNYPKFIYPDNFYQKLLNGQKFEIINSYIDNSDSELFRLYCKGEFIGLGKKQEILGKEYMLVYKKLVR